MKIAFLVFKFPKISETFILNQIAGLLERGHEVDIYPAFKNQADISKVHPIVEKHCLIDHTYYPPIPNNYLWRVVKSLGLLFKNINKGSLRCLPLLNFFKYGHPAYSLRWFYQGMLLLQNSAEYDIVQAQFGPLGKEAMVFKKLDLLSGKLITTFRGGDISKYILSTGEDTYERLFAEGDFFLTNCEFFRNRTIKLGCQTERIKVHGSGIDCNQFSFTPRYYPSDGKVRIATTGRLIEKKGIEYGIRAIANLVRTYPQIEYIIVGDGSLMEYFRQLTQELELDSNVKLAGQKNQSEIIKILDSCHIFIAPCVTATNGDQDAPVNTLKEAMAMGLPVISTWHGGIPELVEDGVSGFLVPERDADAIADKISYLIEHPERWVEIGKAGRNRVAAKYDMNKLNDELVDVYQQVLFSELV